MKKIKSKRQLDNERRMLYHPHRELKEKLTRADKAALKRAYKEIEEHGINLFGSLFPIFDFDLELNKILDEQSTAIANVTNTLRAHLIKLEVLKEN